MEEEIIKRELNLSIFDDLEENIDSICETLNQITNLNKILTSSNILNEKSVKSFSEKY